MRLGEMNVLHWTDQLGRRGPRAETRWLDFARLEDRRTPVADVRVAALPAVEHCGEAQRRTDGFDRVRTIDRGPRLLMDARG